MSGKKVGKIPFINLFLCDISLLYILKNCREKPRITGSKAHASDQVTLPNPAPCPHPYLMAGLILASSPFYAGRGAIRQLREAVSQVTCGLPKWQARQAL